MYLEFPADPWQHFARTNEWAHLRTVTEHSTWIKSSYFLAYSLIGRVTPPLLQLKWFNGYYTSCCLLLCWQYYRLAWTVGLSQRPAFGFVLVQVLLFGNFIFGFYRYYGMASTIFAQIGAVGLTRIALEWAKGREGRAKCKSENAEGAALPHGFWSGLSAHRFSLSSCRRAAAAITASTLPRRNQTDLRPPSSVSPSVWIGRFALAASLLALIAFNHGQGLGIAAFGVLAVALWRLIAWKRPALWWLGAATLILNVAAVLWWPRNPLLDSTIRPTGWLTPWYGFNLFFPPTAPFGAFDRSMAIFGGLGVLNLGAALLLLRRNHIVAWLTLLPPLALSLPLVAIPFSGIILKHSPAEGVDTFPRLLLAIPAGLALVAVAKGSFASGRRSKIAPKAKGWAPSFAPPYWLLLVSLAALVLVPASRPYYNRFYNVVSVPPDDLAMRHVLAAANTASIGGAFSFISLDDINAAALLNKSVTLLTTPGIAYVLQSTGKVRLPWATKLPYANMSATTNQFLSARTHIDPQQIHSLPFWPIPNLYSASSQAGLLSAHWTPAAVALEHAAQAELFRPSSAPTVAWRPPQLWLESFTNEGAHYYFSRGAGAHLLVNQKELEYLKPLPGFTPPAANDRLILRPVLRTLDGNGWRVSVNVTGPNSFRRHFEVRRHPDLLGGDSWIFSDFEIQFPYPGEYRIALIGDTVWPAKTYSVHYKLTALP